MRYLVSSSSFTAAGVSSSRSYDGSAGFSQMAQYLVRLVVYRKADAKKGNSDEEERVLMMVVRKCLYLA
eukprot:CAMPEP_0195541124 /NCGR_PEP_ID=MMETSP0794_2-20130614/50925_1 /TAXON_ID=515487 /ORGANISM="Stephanopyxis turris, Strain CCMP 815" /LENGTH=68 /DNA_ID=CAMNT_0040675209 /DNA_START=446 /DNA_END=652 /DNA_ORIENTATION=+